MFSEEAKVVWIHDLEVPKITPKKQETTHIKGKTEIQTKKCYVCKTDIDCLVETYKTGRTRRIIEVYGGEMRHSNGYSSVKCIVCNSCLPEFDEKIQKNARRCVICGDTVRDRDGSHKLTDHYEFSYMSSSWDPDSVCSPDCLIKLITKYKNAVEEEKRRQDEMTKRKNEWGNQNPPPEFPAAFRPIKDLTDKIYAEALLLSIRSYPKKIFSEFMHAVSELIKNSRWEVAEAKDGSFYWKPEFKLSLNDCNFIDRKDGSGNYVISLTKWELHKNKWRPYKYIEIEVPLPLNIYEWIKNGGEPITFIDKGEKELPQME